MLKHAVIYVMKTLKFIQHLYIMMVYPIRSPNMQKRRSLEGYTTENFQVQLSGELLYEICFIIALFRN